MQHDDLIWSLIKRNHCSFRLASNEKQKFCSNVYNNTGLCNHTSCPLANSQYATIREVDGRLYLYMKVVERAAFPNRLWERVVLPNDYLKSLKLISRHLAFWQPTMVFKVKQRYTRMKQYMVRKKRLMKKEPEIHLPLLHSKHHKREKKLEQKAMKAAKIEKVVENELKERLRQGVYSDIYNFDQKIFDSITDRNKESEKMEIESGDEMQYEEEEEEDVDEEFEEPIKELVESDFEQSDGQEDIEETASTSTKDSLKRKSSVKSILSSKDSKEKTKSNKKHKKVEFEYETEDLSTSKKPLTKLKLNF